MLLFYLRKQESGIRADINGSIQRLQTEKEADKKEIEELREQLAEKEDEIDALRKERRDAEDRENAQRRRAEALQAQIDQGQPWITKG